MSRYGDSYVIMPVFDSYASMSEAMQVFCRYGDSEAVRLCNVWYKCRYISLQLCRHAGSYTRLLIAINCFF
jgi:hypothetical protein